MAKESGLGMAVSVDTSTPTLTDISADITGISFATPRALQDVTGIDKSATERLPLLSDFNASVTGVFNDALSFTVYKDAHSHAQVRTLTIAHSGNTLSCETYASWSLTRSASGELTWTADHQLQSGTAPAWA